MHEMTQIDLETLARTGPTQLSPCGDCGKQTKSHVVVHDGSKWRELSRRDPLGSVEPGTTVKFVVVCHSCFKDMDDNWEPSNKETLVPGEVA